MAFTIKPIRLFSSSSSSSSLSSLSVVMSDDVSIVELLRASSTIACCVGKNVVGKNVVGKNVVGLNVGESVGDTGAFVDEVGKNVVGLNVVGLNVVDDDEGVSVGISDFVGVSLDSTEGLSLGFDEGGKDSSEVGFLVGRLVGLGVVRATLGVKEGEGVGAMVGLIAGTGVGALVGFCVGVKVGAMVGLTVGT